MEDRPKRIRAEILPFDLVDIDPLLDELAARAFIKRYTVDGKRYIQVLKFLEHQKPHATEKDSAIPDENGFCTVHERTKNNCVTGKFSRINVLTPTDNSYLTVKQPLDNALNPYSLNPESWGIAQQSITIPCSETTQPERLNNPEQGHDPPPKNPPSGKTSKAETASHEAARVAAVSARALEVAVLLKRRGVSIPPGDVRMRRWAQDGISDAILLAAVETAGQRRLAQGSLSPVNAGLIDSILADAQAPPARASPPVSGLRGAGKQAVRDAYLCAAEAAAKKHGLDELRGDDGRREHDISGQCARVA